LPYCLSICSMASSTAFSFSVAIVRSLYHVQTNPIKGKSLPMQDEPGGGIDF
jgi:hypothetical protein